MARANQEAPVGYLGLALSLVTLITAWCLWCWFWPITYCRGCKGRKGQGLGATKYGWHRCGRCGGTGEQYRATARLISRLTGKPVRDTK